MPTNEAGARPYCTFEVAGLRLGVDIRDVQEVIRHREPTRVPTAPPSVRGLINLRGQIVTLMDLRALLGLGPDPEVPQPMDVVLRTPGGAIGLVVDEVGDVLEIDARRIDRTPETVPASVRRMTSGLSTGSGRPLLILDVAGLAGGEVADAR